MMGNSAETPSLDLLVRLQRMALRAVLTASENIMTLYRAGSFGVILKSDQTPLTQADMVAHSTIRQLLGESRIPLLSEEGPHFEYLERRDWKFYWLVDPLDGTRGFISESGDFTVNVALIHRDRAVLGVIDVPAEGMVYFNWPGRGAYRRAQSHELLKLLSSNEVTDEELLAGAEPLPVVGIREPGGALRVVGSLLNMSAEMSPYIDRLRALHGAVSVEKIGSSLKFCRLAEGSVDLYPRISRTMEWDTAAGQAVVEAAGMEVVNFISFEPQRYNKESLENGPFVARRSGLDVPRLR